MNSSEGLCAWVVTWSTQAYGRSRRVSRACLSEAEARELATEIETHLVAGSIEIDYAPDLTVEEVYPAFVASLGGEVSPHVIRVRDDVGFVDVVVDPAEVVRRAYLEDDYFDDRSFPVIPKAVHPRRLGVISLVGDLEDELAASGTVRDIRTRQV